MVLTVDQDGEEREDEPVSGNVSSVRNRVEEQRTFRRTSSNALGSVGRSDHDEETTYIVDGVAARQNPEELSRLPLRMVAQAQVEQRVEREG